MSYIKYILGRIRFHFTNYFKPLIVHTEAIFINEVYEKIKKKVAEGNVKTWYIMTPVNYDYFKAYFNIKMPESELSKIMKERYKWMLKNGQRLELHVHLSALMDISCKEQEKIITSAIKWMERELSIKPKEFLPGWWAYDENTLKILKKHNLKMIKQNDYKSTHDYNWVKRASFII